MEDCDTSDLVTFLQVKTSVDETVTVHSDDLGLRFSIAVLLVLLLIWLVEVVGSCCSLGRRPAQFVYLASSILNGAAFTILLVVSLPYTQSLGRSLASSGLLVSSNAVGGLAAQLLAPYIVPDEADSTIASIRRATASTLSGQVAVNTAFVLSAYTIRHGNLLWSSLILFRILSGFFGALTALTASLVALHMSPKSEVMNLQTASQACRNLGLCVGAALSSVSLSTFQFAGYVINPTRLGTVPVMFLILLVLLVLMVNVFFVPNSFAPEQQEPEVVPESSSPNASVASTPPAKVLVASREEPADHELAKRIHMQGYLYTFERSFSTTSIEVATTLISEQEFGFSPSLTGYIFGGITICSVILNLAVGCTSSDVPTRSWVMLLSAFGGILCVAFIYKTTIWPFYFLYIGDCFLFMLSNTANGVVDGIATLVAIPGSDYTRKTYMNRKLISMAVARFAAAPAARGIIDLTNRNVYATFQLLLTVLGFCSAYKIYAATTSAVNAHVAKAYFLFSSLKFCWDVSCQLRRLNGEVNDELRKSVAVELRSLAEKDVENLEKFKALNAKGAAMSWWLLANVFVAVTLCRSRGWSLILLLPALLNGLCIASKSGLKISDISPNSIKDYALANLKLLVALALLTLPVLLLNIVAWAAVETAVCCASLPLSTLSLQFLVRPLSATALHYLSWGILHFWVAAKSIMLLEVLVNHQYYRTYLQNRRRIEAPSLKFHMIDALYGFSYSILALCCANTVLEHCAFYQRSWMPNCWSPLGIILLLALRGPFLPLMMKTKAMSYFCMHRLLHVQPFYTCWHKERGATERPLLGNPYLLAFQEHHFSASQTCLTGCQEAGLLESAAEVLYTHMAFVLVPFFDHVAYLWAAILNCLNHHYYNEYQNLHWRLAKWMLSSQRCCREWFFSKLEPAFPPRISFFLSSLLAENLQFPSANYKNPWLGLGFVEEMWHGRHHWTTERHFGYGTYDSVSNLGASNSQGTFDNFVEEYLGLLRGQIQTASIVSRPMVEKKTEKEPEPHGCKARAL